MSSLESLLQTAGFTDYEARAYIALLQKSPQTGYELAKTSRIPRSNIYGVLQKLELRGAAMRLVSPDTTRYLAVEPETVLQKMKDSFGNMIRDLETSIQSLSNQDEHLYVEHFRGYDNLLIFTKTAMEKANQRLLLALHPQESQNLQTSIQEVSDRDVPIGVLCLHGCKSPCQACRGDFFQTPFARQSGPRWLIAIVDGKSLVAGEIDGENVTGIRTKLPLIAKIAALYMEQSILLSILFNHEEAMDTSAGSLASMIRATCLKHSELLQACAVVPPAE